MFGSVYVRLFVCFFHLVIFFSGAMTTFRILMWQTFTGYKMNNYLQPQWVKLVNLYNFSVISYSRICEKSILMKNIKGCTIRREISWTCWRLVRSSIFSQMTPWEPVTFFYEMNRTTLISHLPRYLFHTNKANTTPIAANTPPTIPPISAAEVLVVSSVFSPLSTSTNKM